MAGPATMAGPAGPVTPVGGIPMSNGSRPLSPHLQIYRPQITSVLSISPRATSVALAVGAVELVWWLLAAADGPESYAPAAGFLGSFCGLFGRCRRIELPVQLPAGEIDAENEQNIRYSYLQEKST